MCFRTLLFPLFVVVAGGAVTSCGLKGPLYQPEQPGAVSTSQTDAANPETEKLRRPRPAPQAQKQPAESDPSAAPPVGSGAAETNPSGLESLPADESR